MKTVYFVRHGQSEHNVSGITAGSGIDTSLTETGIQQAKEAGKQLKGKGIELIVCSPMLRTRETARYIANEIGYGVKSIEFNDSFIERDVGVYSDKMYKVYRKALSEGVGIESIEPTEALYKRVSDGLAWLSKRKESTILIVSHGGTGRMVRLINKGLDHSRIYEIAGFGNTEIDEFKL